jgi:hypothetical protein
MHLKQLSTPILALTCLGLIAGFAPPDGKGKPDKPGDGDPPAAFEPEFAGIRIGGRNKSDQLVLTDRSASAEIVAHQAVGIRSVDLSVDTAGLIAFKIDDSLYLQSWSSDDGFVVSEPNLAYQNTNGLGPPDFSPNGSRIAFLESRNGTAMLSICDIDPVELECATVTPQTTLTRFGEWQLDQVKFHPDRNGEVVFTGRPPGVVSGGGVYLYELDGAAPSHAPLIPEVRYFDDVGPASADNDPLLVSSHDGQPKFYSLRNGAPVSPNFSGFGYGFHFNCSSNALLYLETAHRGGPFIAVTAFGGPIEKLTNKGWNINAGHDWMRKASCL